MYEVNHEFFEVSGYFGKDCDAIAAETKSDDHRTFQQGKHSKVYVQIF